MPGYVHPTCPHVTRLVFAVLETQFRSCHSFPVSAPKYFPVKDRPICFPLNVLYIVPKKVSSEILNQLRAHRRVINFASVPPSVSPWVASNGCRSGHRVPQKWHFLTTNLSFWTDWLRKVHRLHFPLRVHIFSLYFDSERNSVLQVFR